MNVLSLFDGMSCGQIALERAGIKVDNYFASEVDKHAIAVTMANYPKTIQLGDVTKVSAMQLPKIDIMIGGSPCQGFSFAGKQLNFNDPRSKLFFEYVRLLKECEPKYFLLENVRMKKEYQDIITQYLGVEPIEINSSLVSAQNRIRLYWTNIPNITKPDDKYILLKDIINQDYDGIWVFPRGNNSGGIKNYNNKSPSITTSSWEYNFLIYKAAALRTFPRFKTVGEKRIKQLEIRKDLKSNCITTHNLDSLLSKDDGSYRKFSPEEVEQLQTVPIGYTRYTSNSQRYRMLGNGWTVDVIVHILKSIPL
jgi:DNA (cytosine-5)-methyltransferase 3A